MSTTAELGPAGRTTADLGPAVRLAVVGTAYDDRRDRVVAPDDLSVELRASAHPAVLAWIS